MNIKNRLQKLESMIQTGGGFCVCPNVIKTEIWRADLSVKSDTSEPYLHSNAVPGVCEQCRQPIEKRVITLRFVDRATKDRFPAEWAART